MDVFWPYLHAIPEPAFREIKTSAFVAEVLRIAGYSVEEEVGGTTAVVGILDSGRPGPVAAVRSDMDCLLFKQEDARDIDFVQFPVIPTQKDMEAAASVSAIRLFIPTYLNTYFFWLP